MIQNRTVRRLTELAFYIGASACVLLLTALFATALYLQSQRPVTPDIVNGFVVWTKIISGIVFVSKNEQSLLHWLSLLSFLAVLCTLALKVIGRR